MTDLHARAIITAVDGVSGPMAAMARSFAGVNRSWSQSIGNMGDAMARTGRAVTFGFTVPAVLAVRRAMEVDDVIGDMAKVFMGTDQQLDATMRQIDQFARTIPLARDEIIKLYTAANQANVPLKEQAGFVQLASEFMVAFDTTADESAKTLARLRTAFGYNNEQLRFLGDSMNVIANNSAAAEKEILQVYQDVGSLFKATGDKGAVEQIGALGGALVAMNVPVEKAGTGIRNLFVDLSAGAAAPARVKEGLAKLGLEANTVAKTITTDTMGTFLDIFERIQKLPKHERASVLNQLASKRAIDAFMPILGNLEEYIRLLGLLHDKEKVAGSMHAEYEKRLERAGPSWQLFKNAIEGVSLAMVQRWMPALMRAADGLSGFFNSLKDQPALTRWAADVGGALALLGPALWVVGAGLRGIVDSVGVVGKGIAGMARIGVWRLGLLGAAAWGLYEAGQVIAKNWDEELAGKWDRASKAGQKLGDALANLAGLDVPEGGGWDYFIEQFDEATINLTAAALDKMANGLNSLANAANNFAEGEFVQAFKDLGSLFPDTWEGWRDKLLPFYGKEHEMAKMWGKKLGIDIENPPRVTVEGLTAPGVTPSWLKKGAPPPKTDIIPPPSPSFFKHMGAIVPPGMEMPSSGGPLIRDVAGPQTIDVTGKVDAELRGRGQVNVNVKVEGPGQITGMSAHDDGKNLELDVGASMPDSGG